MGSQGKLKVLKEHLYVECSERRRVGFLDGVKNALAMWFL